MSRESERDLRAIDRKRQLTQEELQTADVVLVAVRCDAGLDAMRVLAQPGEVGQHEVDAVHVGIGKHEPTVDEEQPVVVFDDHAIATDLAETAEEDDSDVFGHQRAAERAARRLSSTFCARSASPAGGGPIGRRASPTLRPSRFIITLLGSGFGLSSPVS